VLSPARAAVVLAAGASRRMGTPKAQLTFSRRPDGTVRTFLDRILDLALVGCPADALVVVGRPEGLAGVLPPGARAVANPDPARGMFSSIRVGLQALAERLAPPAAVMLLLVDHPLVQPRTVARLWAAAEAGSREVAGAAGAAGDAAGAAGVGAVVPVYAGSSGHPIVLYPELARLALEAPADARLDRLVAQLPVQAVPVADPGVVRDIDTREGYERFFGFF
jgi:molybdenum cofactor cytidylyltransferase